MVNKRNPKLNVVSLFAGAGGLELALCKTLQVRNLVSTDSNPIFLDTVKQNLPKHFDNVDHTCLDGDVRDLSGKNILKIVGNSCNLLIGGPPCDDFTITGKRKGITGEKGPLIFEYLRILKELRPSCFVFENVPNLASQFRDSFDFLVSKMNSSGYTCHWTLLKACDYGDPTIRKRIFIVGFDNKHDIKDYNFPTPSHADITGQIELFDEALKAQPYKTVAEALNGLPDTSIDTKGEAFNHTGRPHRKKTIEGFRELAQGIWLRKSFRYRLIMDEPARSLTAGTDTNCKSYIHPKYHREMSVREYARIHSFPDTWIFSGNHHNGLKQVANSVPINLGAAIMKSLIKPLENILNYK